MTPAFAAPIGLGISQGIHATEAFRVGMLSAGAGQYEAAKAIDAGQ